MFFTVARLKFSKKKNNKKTNTTLAGWLTAVGHKNTSQPIGLALLPWYYSLSMTITSTTTGVTAHSAGTSHRDIAAAVTLRYIGSKPQLAILLINALLSSQGNCACIPLVRSVPLPPRHHHHATGREEGAEDCSLQLCPYSQHLTRGPDVHTGSSNNLSNVSPLWEPGTCKRNPSIQHDGIITGLISLHLEELV